MAIALSQYIKHTHHKKPLPINVECRIVQLLPIRTLMYCFAVHFQMCNFCRCKLKARTDLNFKDEYNSFNPFKNYTK